MTGPDLTNSATRRSGKHPAYWVSEFGVFSETAVPGSRALRWSTAPLTFEQIDALFQQSGGDSLTFARLVEEAHGVYLE